MTRRMHGILGIALGIVVAACHRGGKSGTGRDGGTDRGSASTRESEGGSAGGGDAGAAAKTTELQGMSGPYNVLLISIDSLRADMPWAGYERPIAPRLSELRKKSVTYSRAYATSSFTSKSIPGILTGKYPSELTRTGSFFTKYLNPADFTCTSLDAQGIPCLGGHAHAYFGKGQSGFESGFRDWQLVPGIAFDYQSDPYVTSDKLTTLAKSMLSAPGLGAEGHPFFAWFHYMDPHDKYQPHAESPHYGKRPRDLYDEEVFWTDLWIGQLLDFVAAQPWASRTAIIVTADHGEMFGEHGMTRHAHELWEELIRVPLFVHVPGLAPLTIDEPRGAMDLAPTFVELLSAKMPPGLRGTSLGLELRGGHPGARDVMADLPEDEYNERRRAFIHGQTKLIAFGRDVRYSLYDLAADPTETTDLARKRPELLDEMRERYKEYSKTVVESAPKGGIPRHDGP